MSDWVVNSMILRQKPDHPEDYYIVDIGEHLRFSSMGFSASYMWKGKFYYKKFGELTRLIEMEGGEGN